MIDPKLIETPEPKRSIPLSEIDPAKLSAGRTGPSIPIENIAPEHLDLNSPMGDGRPLWQHAVQIEHDRAKWESPGDPLAVRAATSAAIDQWQGLAQNGQRQRYQQQLMDAPSADTAMGRAWEWTKDKAAAAGTGYLKAVSGPAALAFPETINQYHQSLDRDAELPDTFGNRVASLGGGAIPMVASAIVSGGATAPLAIGAASRAGGARQEIAAAKQSLRESGQDPNQITVGQEIGATLLGGAVGAAEGVVAGKLIHGAGNLWQGISSPLTRYAGIIGTEIGANALTAAGGQFAQNQYARSTYDPNRPALQNVGESALEAGVLGLATSPFAIGADNRTRTEYRNIEIGKRIAESAASPGAFVAKMPSGRAGYALQEVGRRTGYEVIPYHAPTDQGAAALIDGKKLYVRLDKDPGAGTLSLVVHEAIGHGDLPEPVKNELSKLVNENKDAVNAAAELYHEDARSVAPETAAKLDNDPALKNSEGVARFIEESVKANPDMVDVLAEQYPSIMSRIFSKVKSLVGRGDAKDRVVKQQLELLGLVRDTAPKAAETLRNRIEELRRKKIMDDAPILEETARRNADELTRQPETFNIGKQLAETVDRNADQLSRPISLPVDQAVETLSPEDAATVAPRIDELLRKRSTRDKARLIDEAMEAIPERRPAGERRTGSTLEPVPDVVKRYEAENFRRQQEELAAREARDMAEAERERQSIADEAELADQRMVDIGLVPDAAMNANAPDGPGIRSPEVRNLEDRLLEAYKDSPEYQSESERSDALWNNQDEHGGSPDVYRTIPEGLRNEFTDAEWKTIMLRGLLRKAKSNDKAAHLEDYYSEHGWGHKRYVEWLRSRLDSNSAKRPVADALRWAENSRDPQHQLLAKSINDLRDIRKGIADKPAAGSVEVDADQLRVGAEFQMRGREMKVEELHGEPTLTDGPDFKPMPLEQLDKVPVDKGTLRQGEGNTSATAKKANDDIPFAVRKREEVIANGQERQEGRQEVLTDKDAVRRTIAADGVPFAIRRRPAEEDSIGSKYTIDGEGWFTRLFRRVADEMKPVSRMVKNIKEQGGTVTNDSNPYLIAELFRGRTANEIEKVKLNYQDPILQRMAKAKLTLEDVDEYLTAQHAPERNAHVAAINPKMPDGGSGITNAEAATIMDKWQADPRINDMKWVSDQVLKMNRGTRKLMLDSGLITADQYNEMESAYQHYVPLRTDMEADGLPASRPGQGYHIKGREYKAATGRGEGNVADSPLTFSLIQRMEKIVRSEKQVVDRSMLKLVEDNPDPDLWTVHKGNQNYPTMPAVVDGKVRQVPDPTFKDRPDVLALKVDGKPVLIQFKQEGGKRIAAAMKRLNYADGGDFIRSIAKIGRAYASMQTNRNPEFILPNFIRDVATAGLNMTAEQGPKFAMGMLKRVLPSWKAIYKATGDPTAKPTDPIGKYFEEYKNAGGRVSAYHLPGFEHTLGGLESQLADINAKGLRKLKVVSRKAIDWIDRLNGATETATRLAAYIEAREGGMEIREAASLAKNLTVNFERKGELGPIINSLYLFSNANIQGSVRMAKALTSTPRGRKLAAFLASGGLAAGMVLRNMFGEDEAGNNVYDTIPDQIKATNLIIPLSGLTYAKIPLPYGFNAIYSAGRLAGETIVGGKTPAAAASDLITTAADAFNPLGNEGSLLQTLSPTIADPFVQWGQNLDWTGKPIVPEQMAFGPQKPQSQLARRDTSGFAKTIAQWLNSLTGGDEVTSGAIDISPALLDHFTGWATGGLGRFIGKTVDLPSKLASGDATPNLLPFASRFSGMEPQGTIQRGFYDTLKLAQDAQADLRHYQESGQPDKAVELMQEKEKELGFARWANDIRKAGSTLRKEMDQQMESGDEAGAKETRRKIDSLMAGFSKAYKNNQLPEEWKMKNELAELEQRDQAYRQAQKEMAAKNGDQEKAKSTMSRVKLSDREKDRLQRLRTLDGAAGKIRKKIDNGELDAARGQKQIDRIVSSA